MSYRIGQGFDIHQFTPGKVMKLGGIEIPDVPGFKAHSDGDVLLHAIIDAIIGALALGDIGQWFPDNDDTYKNADSRQLLKQVLNDPQVAAWHVVNLDCTVITQIPKLSPRITQIREMLGFLLETDISRISVKAKTNEHLDAIGEGKAASAHAVVLLSDTPEER